MTFFTSTRLKWISLFGFSLTIAFFSSGQVIQNGRYEVNIGLDIEHHEIVSLDTSGLLLFRSFIGAKENQIEITRLDTAFNRLWHGFIPVAKEYSFAHVLADESKVFFFFKGLPNNGYVVMVVNIKDGSYHSANIKIAVPFNPVQFVVGKQSILIGGYFNYRPIVLHYSMRSDKARLLPGFLNEPGELLQIKTYNNGNVDVVASAKNVSRRKCIWIRHFDNNGDLIKTTIIEPDQKKNLIFGRATKMIDNNQIIAGVYGRNSTYVRGIFVADVNIYGEYKIHYYNFADLKNFFHYMKAKREKRIKERIERRKIKGKKNKFNYRLMVHELIPYNDQFVMLGEAFIPRYTNRPMGSGGMGSSAPTGAYGMGGATSRAYSPDLVFDGYQYTHAVVIGFDKNGELVWDNSFEINGIKVFQLDQFVKIFPAKDHVVLVYTFENAIRSKIIRGDQVLEGTVQTAMSAKDGGQIFNTKAGKLEYWYGNHFFVSGVQNVRTEQGIRKVFFINRLKAY